MVPFLSIANSYIFLVFHNKRTGTVTVTVTEVSSCNGYRGHYRACYKGVCPVIDYRGALPV